jgi:hypothetical protein
MSTAVDKLPLLPTRLAESTAAAMPAGESCESCPNPVG